MLIAIRNKMSSCTINFIYFATFRVHLETRKMTFGSHFLDFFSA